MKSLKLILESSCACKIGLAHFLCGCLFLASFVFSQQAFAQSVEQPVARLVSASAPGNPATSRPRRISDPEKTNKFERVTSVHPSFDDATTIEQRAFEETNAARLKHGRTAFEWDPQLCLLARQHSESMAQRGYFDHDTPEGLQPKHRARALGLRFRVLGENIAYNKGYEDPGAFAVARWMISGGHRENILYIGFQASAVGSYIAPDGSVYLTQLFIAR